MLEHLFKGIAIWRLTHLLVEEDGPFEVFKTLRRVTGIEEVSVQVNPDSVTQWPEYETRTIHPSWNPLYCMWCTSVWIAGLSFIWPSWFERLLALSGIAMIVEGWHQHGES